MGKKVLGIILVVLGLALLHMGVIVGGFFIGSNVLAEVGAGLYLWQSEVVVGLEALVLLLFLIYAAKQSWIGFRGFSFGKMAVLVVLGLLMVLVFEWLALIFLPAGKTTSGRQEILELMQYFPTVVLAFNFMVYLPMMEEFVFRGLLMDKVFGSFSWWSVLLSGILYAVCHTPDSLVAWILYLGLGWVFSGCYAYSRRLDYNLILHVLYGAVAFSLLYMGMY
ncbi:CPBP family intramembrane glutamic endopeptidase [Streptococcus loxodontisalivarius]|uniref:Membrane protease YdiL (CAAX protease family) n=1 Tax=Streptococcus loxodontisalivarius TaxID=1349415 RepID=A0ABS2PVK7_9STRE|nr:CPBP family intramembrane glutamic endopeptidase [Streptococcus loxodontisalivarius]MBM7643560.1 membrane protease YdiL (CAAX protease family) [Streptococcus loxodontisalivarius]